MAKFIKYDTQNIIDFTQTNYGSIDRIFDFLAETDYNDYNEFIADTSKTLDLEPAQNNVSDNYIRDFNVVSSILPNEFTANLICNDDLAPKTLVVGDYNNDYNDDYLTTKLIDFVVGYSGMDVYILWSVTNTGSKIGTASGTLAFTGYSNRTISQEIKPNETYHFEEIYEDVPAGIKTVTLSGNCTQTLVLEVLGNAEFQCNNDFAITEPEPIYSGDTITLTWSVDNIGDAAGIYEGTFYYTIQSLLGEPPTTEEIEYSVNIPASGTYNFSEEITVNNDVYTFTSTCGQIINLNVIPTVLEPNLDYNNDLAISPTNPSDGDLITVTWSITNNGTGDGIASGYMEYYPAVNYTKFSYQDIAGEVITIAPTETYTFSKQINVQGGERQILLTGNAIDTLDFTVSYNSIIEYAFWGSTENTIPTEPIYSQQPITVRRNNSAYFKVWLLNPNLATQTKTVKLQFVNGNSGFIYNFYNNDVSIPYSATVADGTYVGSGMNSNIAGTHLIKLYLDNVYRSSIQYKII